MDAVGWVSRAVGAGHGIEGETLPETLYDSELLDNQGLGLGVSLFYFYSGVFVFVSLSILIYMPGVN